METAWRFSSLQIEQSRCRQAVFLQIPKRSAGQFQEHDGGLQVGCRAL